MTDDLDLFRRIRTCTAEEFFRSKFDITAIGENGQSLLHEAISYRKPETAKGLIERGAKLDVQNNRGETPLHYAAAYGALETTELLLSKGANPNLADIFGNYPVWTAAMFAKGDFRLVSSLVKGGADVHHKNKAGKSLMDFALQSRNKALWVAAGGNENDFKAV